MSCTLPPDSFFNMTLPSPPTLTVTWFGMICPGMKFRLDAVGIAVPDGYTVTNPNEVGSLTVTLSTTAATPEEGTPPCPVTWRLTVPFAATGAWGAPTPSRVSNNRYG